MCIRDRKNKAKEAQSELETSRNHAKDYPSSVGLDYIFSVCLLYTSDAADERSSVDLGGRRIIKKKKKCVAQCNQKHHKLKKRSDIQLQQRT